MFRLLKTLIGWYGRYWIIPLGIFILLTLLALPCFILVLMVGNWHGGLFEHLLDLMLTLQLLHCGIAVIAGVVLLFRRRFIRALIYFAESAVFFVIMFLMGMFAMFATAFLDNDHFADNLELPKDVLLSEPLDGGFTSSRSVLTDAFEKEVVGAIGNGPTLTDTEECHLPALERLMATSEGKRKVLDYLAASSEWMLRYNEIDRLYATRNSRDSNGMVDCNENHAHFPSYNVTTKQKEGLHAQYSFRIYFDGPPNRLFAKGMKPFDCLVRGKKDTTPFYVDTWLMAGTARIFIYDESLFPGRQMTAKMVELVNREFEALEHTNDLSVFGEKRPMEVKLYNNTQPGLYLLDIWCNPGETGILMVRAKEITKGTPLSETRLPEHQVKVYGCPQADVSFNSQIDFTIFEGNWDQYYGACFELWFKPDSGAPERKLWSDNYRIQGWQR